MSRTTRQLAGSAALLLILAGLATPGAQAQEAAPPAEEQPASATGLEGGQASAVLEDMALPVGLPEPQNPRLIDVPGDDGRGAGVQFDFGGGEGNPAAAIGVLVGVESGMLEPYALSSAELDRLAAERQRLAADLAPILPQLATFTEQLDAATTEYNLALANGDATIRAKRAEKWRIQKEINKLQRKQDKARNRFQSAAGRLAEKKRFHDYISGAIDGARTDAVWAQTNIAGLPARLGEGLPLKGAQSNRFGVYADSAPDSGAAWLEVREFTVANPNPDDPEPAAWGETPPGELTIPFVPGRQVSLLLRVSAEGVEPLDLPLGNVTPQVNYFKPTLFNNLLFALFIATVLVLSILAARRNPNLFIRRIAGLEAVDEAIGRATEMGKPVLYLNGMDPMETLATIASVNILGRVARRVADFDSNLIVPARDPVVFTVAQEVVKAGYMDAGRPDAFRAENVFFVTDDQFSYTAHVCGIMLREKPAANFFMGYYYAEALLLAETGGSTGAIQIAGTDSQPQLPFFITACDYTLIGEELYAASAYLSREPMLLGSLKGQDIVKASMMILILLQTLLFALAFFADKEGWDWLQLLVTPL